MPVTQKKSMHDLDPYAHSVTELGRTYLAGMLCTDMAFPSALMLSEMVGESICKAALMLEMAKTTDELQGINHLT
jgi:hypothetical protein